MRIEKFSLQSFWYLLKKFSLNHQTCLRAIKVLLKKVFSLLIFPSKTFFGETQNDHILKLFSSKERQTKNCFHRRRDFRSVVGEQRFHYSSFQCADKNIFFTFEQKMSKNKTHPYTSYLEQMICVLSVPNQGCF